MEWSRETVVPAARADGLVVEQMDAETLIYDLERDQAHNLNLTAAVVFGLCDGRRTFAQLVDSAADRLGQPVSSEAVWSALEQLADRELLAGALERHDGLARRDVVRKAAAMAAGAAVAAPIVKSVVAPTPALAQSPPCLTQGQTCSVEDGEPCCEDLSCQGVNPKSQLGTCQPTI